MKTILRWTLALGALALTAGAWAGSLTLSNYSEVVVENLNIGKSYGMIETANLPLILINEDGKANWLKVEVLQPGPKQLKPGFEPIPDVSWIEIKPREFEVAAHGTYQTDVRITIPDKNAFLGKKYQANINARIIPKTKEGTAIALAVQGRLLFTISNEMQNTSTAKINLNFTLTPARLEMLDVPLGKKIEVKTGKSEPVLAKNEDRSRIQLMLQSLDPKDTVLSIEKGYQACPSPDFLTFPQEELTLDPGTEKPLKLFLEIPDQAEYRGKKYLFIASLKTGSSMTGVRYLQILVNTASASAK